MLNPIEMQTENACKEVLSEVLTRFDEQLSVKQLYKRIPMLNEQAVRNIAHQVIITARRPQPSPQLPQKEQPLKDGIDYDLYMPKKLLIETPHKVSSPQPKNYTGNSLHIPVLAKAPVYKKSSSLRDPVMLGEKISARESRENGGKAKEEQLESSLNQMRRLLLMQKQKNGKVVPIAAVPRGCPCCMKIRKPPRNFTFDYNGRIMPKTYYQEDSFLVESPIKTHCRKAKIIPKTHQQPVLPPSRMQQTPTPQIRRKRRLLFENGQLRQSSHIPYIQLSQDVTLRENAHWEHYSYDREASERRDTNEKREKPERRTSSTFTHFGLKEKHEDRRLDDANLSSPQRSMEYKNGRISVNAMLQKQLH